VIFFFSSSFLAKGNPEKKLKWAFKMYDIDSNGSVDRQEMLKIIEVRLNNSSTKDSINLRCIVNL
jgi:Ca2+-binding EF-hand superfamily protein